MAENTAFVGWIHNLECRLSTSGITLVIPKGCLFCSPLLIFLTWHCIKLHGPNFRPLVWLWRPFHTCFVLLRRGWDKESDITDVFTTFLFLSYIYGKIMCQTFLLNYDEILNINQSRKHFTSYQCVADQSISYGSTYLQFLLWSFYIHVGTGF